MASILSKRTIGRMPGSAPGAPDLQMVRPHQMRVLAPLFSITLVHDAKAWAQTEATLFWHQKNNYLALFSGKGFTYDWASSHAGTQVGPIELAKAFATFSPNGERTS